MQRYIKVGFVVVAISLFVSACGPSQAELDTQATQAAENIYASQTAAAPTATATSTASPTSTSTPPPTSTPTPIPGKFINPPEYLETVFFSDWFWMTNPLGNQVATKFDQEGLANIMMHGEDRGISLSTLFMEAATDEAKLFNDYIASVLIYYVSDTAQEQIAQYVINNTEIGKYETTIKSFGVIYEIYLDKGDRVLKLTIYQK